MEIILPKSVNDYDDNSAYEETMKLRRHKRVLTSLKLFSLMPPVLRASTEKKIGTSH
jgi:hypothetical protein